MKKQRRANPSSYAGLTSTRDSTPRPSRRDRYHPDSQTAPRSKSVSFATPDATDDSSVVPDSPEEERHHRSRRSQRRAHKDYDSDTTDDSDASAARRARRRRHHDEDRAHASNRSPRGHREGRRSPSPAHSDSTVELPARFDREGRKKPVRGDDPIADKIEDFLSGKGSAGKLFKNLTDGILGGGEKEGGRRRDR